MRGSAFWVTGFKRQAVGALCIMQIIGIKSNKGNFNM
jgi:hypothetical protein